MLSQGNSCGFIKSHLLDVCSFIHSFIQDRPGIRPLIAWMIMIMNDIFKKRYAKMQQNLCQRTNAPPAPHRLTQVCRKCPFSSPPLLPPSSPSCWTWFGPVIWILPGLVSPTTTLPERIGPITPQPQPDQSSLSPRERSSKRRFDEQPPSPLSSPPLLLPLHQAENRPRWKTWIAGPWHSAPLSDRPLIPRLSCSHPISSVY